MAIQKKSLITNLGATKKALVANQFIQPRHRTRSYCQPGQNQSGQENDQIREPRQ